MSCNFSSDKLLKALIEGLEQVVDPAHRPAALHEPRFDEAELAAVADCVKSGWVSSVGSYVDKFERELAKISGTGHAVAVVNGTAALQVALIVAGVRPGDEVLVPALTFVATANAVSHVGAVPHFVDSEPANGGVDPTALDAHLKRVGIGKEGRLFNRQTGRPISCIVPMHLFGHPVDMAGILDVANRHGLLVVEDAAEALGSKLGGRSAGSFGSMGVLSFNGNKIVTTGGGGAILTNDRNLAAHAKHLTTTAKVPHPWAFEHDEIGFNYRLPNINAALGVGQLAKLDQRVDLKRRLAARYAEVIGGQRGFRLMNEPPGARSNYWLNTLVLDAQFKPDRDRLLNDLNAAGFMVRPAWKLMSRLAIYEDAPKAALPVAEDLEQRMICLPSSAHLAPGA